MKLFKALQALKKTVTGQKAAIKGNDFNEDNLFIGSTKAVFKKDKKPREIKSHNVDTPSLFI